jgi:hypothetical protein
VQHDVEEYRQTGTGQKLYEHRHVLYFFTELHDDRLLVNSNGYFE